MGLDYLHDFMPRDNDMLYHSFPLEERLGVCGVYLFPRNDVSGANRQTFVFIPSGVPDEGKSLTPADC